MSRRELATGSLLLVAGFLLPKCPLCVAAWLSALGVGASLASLVAPAVRPLAFVLGGMALLLVARQIWRRRA